MYVHSTCKRSAYIQVRVRVRTMADAISTVTD